MTNEGGDAESSGTAAMVFLSLLAALAYSVATFVTVTVSLCGHAGRAGDGKGRGCTRGKT